MSDDRQQTSDEWDAMVKQRAMTDHAQREPEHRPCAECGHCAWQPDFEGKVCEYCHLKTQLTQAHAQGRREGMEEAAALCEGDVATVSECIDLIRAKAKEAGHE